MSTGKLLFHPPFSAPLPSLPAITERLTKIGLLDRPFRPEEQSFLTGPRFPQLITFLGCSPFLRLEPPDDGSSDFCHLRFLGPFDRPRLLYGSNTRAPKCPACARGLDNWQSLAEQWEAEPDNSNFTCPHCGRHSSPLALEWRRKAGFGRFFLQVSEVFPGEAVPVGELMECLRADGDSWDYFYLQKWPVTD
jgi:hypothetical protein